jgi:Ca-activated chloride channel family protein
MLGMVRHAAEKGMYTSLLGVGLDFNADVVEAMSKAKGAWYGSVKTSEAFRKRLDDEFDYMVTPLVFNLRLHLSSDAYVIDKVFGSPESELSSGQLMRINTLFPSAQDEQGQTKGGVVLLRLVGVSGRRVGPAVSHEPPLVWPDRWVWPVRVGAVRQVES